MSGYLEVKYPFGSHIGLNPFKAWRRRWCILRPSPTSAGGSLAVYGGEGGEAGAVALPGGGAVRRARSRSRPHAFGVFAADEPRRPRVLLAARSPREAQHWMDKIRELLDGRKPLGTETLLAAPRDRDASGGELAAAGSPARTAGRPPEPRSDGAESASSASSGEYEEIAEAEGRDRDEPRYETVAAVYGTLRRAPPLPPRRLPSPGVTRHSSLGSLPREPRRLLGPLAAFRKRLRSDGRSRSAEAPREGEGEGEYAAMSAGAHYVVMSAGARPVLPDA